MTIARGLFRLWIVASVVWIGLIGAVYWPIVPEDDNGPWKDFSLGKPPPASNPPPPGFTLDTPATPQAPKPPSDPSKPYEAVPDTQSLPDAP